MNSKEIKALNWHKKSLIDVIRREGIDVDDIDEELEDIIKHLDAERIDRNPIDKARSEGFLLGYKAGIEDGEVTTYNIYD